LPQTIHNPLITDPEAVHDGVTPADGASQSEAPPMAPALADAGPQEPLPTAPLTVSAPQEPPVTTKPAAEQTAATPTPPLHNDR